MSDQAMTGSGDLSRLKDSLMAMGTMDDDEILDFLELDDESFKHREMWANVVTEIASDHVKYRTIYSLVLVWHMMKGYTYLSFGARLGVNDRTCRRWANQFPEFKAAREIGNGFMRMKWEDIATTSAEGTNKGNAATIIFALKNYFPDDFKDKREVEMTGSMYIIDTGIDRQLPMPADVIEVVESLQPTSVTNALEYCEADDEGQEDEYGDDL